MCTQMPLDSHMFADFKMALKRCAPLCIRCSCPSACRTRLSNSVCTCTQIYILLPRCLRRQVRAAQPAPRRPCGSQAGVGQGVRGVYQHRAVFRSTPNRLWKTMIRVWRSGCAPTDDRIAEDCKNWIRNVTWMGEADVPGSVVDELNTRGGRRGAARGENRKLKRKRHREAVQQSIPSIELLKAGFRASDDLICGDEDDERCAKAAEDHAMQSMAYFSPLTVRPTAEMVQNIGGTELRQRLIVLKVSTITEGQAYTPVSELRKRLSEKLGYA